MLEQGFAEFLKEVPANPLKAEYLIPTFIGELLSQNKISVKVLKTNDAWYGMTYKEDVPAVRELCPDAGRRHLPGRPVLGPVKSRTKQPEAI